MYLFFLALELVDGSLRSATRCVLATKFSRQASDNFHHFGFKCAEPMDWTL